MAAPVADALIAFALLDYSTLAAMAALVLGITAQSILTLAILKLLSAMKRDENFIFIPKVARLVNGEPSQTGLNQPAETLLPNEFLAHREAMRFIARNYPGRPDIRPARMKVSLDELKLKD